MPEAEQVIQQKLIESVPAAAHDAILFRLGSLQGVVSLESYSSGSDTAVHPIMTIHDPNDDLELKAVIGSRVEDMPDLSEEQQVQSLVIEGINRMIESKSLHDATMEQVQADLEDLTANVR